MEFKTASDLIFDVNHAMTLLEQNNVESLKLYIRKFFFLFGNEIFVREVLQFKLYDLSGALKFLPNDLEKYDKKIKVFSAKDFIKSSEFMKIKYIPTIDFTKDITFSEICSIKGIAYTNNYINMAKPIKLDITKPYDKDLVKDKLQLIYDHILNIWCSKNNELNEYVLNFIACTLKGRKLRKCLYSQSSERCGRGTIIRLLQNILGNACCKTNSIEVVTKYSKPFEGCVLINLDEMPVDQGNFKSISDHLKELITEPEFSCRDMYQTPYQQKNTFNLIITTNNDAVHLTQTNNERYVCIDVDECMKGNSNYFEPLNKAIENESVQLAFFSDMSERYETLSNWNEDSMPQTKLRKQKICEALPKLYKYIKEEYILKNRDLRMKTQTFVANYIAETKDNTSKEKIGRMLLKIGIEVKKNSKDKKNQFRYYCANNQQLTEIYKKYGWIDEEIDFENVETDLTVADFHDQLADLAEENESLQEDFNELAQYTSMLEKYIESIEEKPPTKINKKISSKAIDNAKSVIDAYDEFF